MKTHRSWLKKLNYIASFFKHTSQCFDTAVKKPFPFLIYRSTQLSAAFKRKNIKECRPVWNKRRIHSQTMWRLTEAPSD